MVTGVPVGHGCPPCHRRPFCGAAVLLCFAQPGFCTIGSCEGLCSHPLSQVTPQASANRNRAWVSLSRGLCCSKERSRLRSPQKQTSGTWLQLRQQVPCCLTVFKWEPADVSGLSSISAFHPSVLQCLPVHSPREAPTKLRNQHNPEHLTLYFLCLRHVGELLKLWKSP